jgi:hypothetical protein
MGTEENSVNGALLLPYHGDQKVVKSFDKIQRIVASGHAGLVGNHKDKKPVTVEHSYGLGHPRKNSEAAQMVDVAHLLIDGPIPIDEYRRFLHFTSSPNKVTGYK